MNFRLSALALLKSPTKTQLAPRRSGRLARRKRRALSLFSIHAIEFLEPRRLLAAVSWTGLGDDTNWSDPNNWSTHSLPGAGDDVTISAAANPGVVYSAAAGSRSIQSLTSSDPFSLTGGALTVTGQIQVSNTFKVTGGTLAQATVVPGSGGQGVTVISGTFDTVTANADLDLTQQNNANLTVYNGLVLNANLLIGNAGGSTYGNVYFGDAGHPAGSLTGTGTVLFGGSSSSDLYNYSNQAGTAGALTIGSGITIHGKNGYVITGYANGTIVNQGTINADTAGGTLTVGPVTNQGTLEATNGGTLTLTGAWDNSAGTLAVNNSTLNLGGSFAQGGTFTRTAGTVNLTGTLTGNLALSATTGTWNLANGTLSHGVYTATGGASLLIKSGTFDTVTANADVDLTQQANANVTIYNGLVLNANLLIGNAGGSTYGNVYFGDAGHPAGSLTGTGTVLFGGSSSSDLYNYSNQAGTAGTLTIGSGITIHGKNGYVITGYANGNIINQGTINADTAGGTLTVGPVTNQGTLEATNGGTLTLTGAWDNSAGTLAVNNGTLNLGGSFAQGGTFTRTAGTVNLTGTLTGNLALSATTGSWNLANGTLSHGVYTATGGASLLIKSGTFDTVTANADVDLTQQANANVTIYNGLVLNANLLIGDAGGSTYGNVYFGDAGHPAGSLTGTGTVLFGGSSSSDLYDYSNQAGAAGALTIGSGITIHGKNGYVITVYANGNIINQGTINADTAGGTLTVGPVTNQGTLEATNGGTLTLTGAWDNSAGTLAVNNGTLNLGGSFAQGGTFTRTAGTVNLTGTLTGNLALSATTGSWNLANGTLSHGVYTATGGASLLIKSGTFDTVTANADVDLTQQANANVTIYNGLVLNANLLIGNAGGSTYGNVYFGDAGHPAGSLTGTGTVLFGGSSSSDLYDYSNQAGAAGALTIGSGITIHGKNGYVITVYANGNIINQGTINADTAGGTLTVGPVTNQGTLEATNGGTLTLTGAWDNSAGTLAVNNGTLNLGGSFAQGGIFTRTAGTVNLTGTLTGNLALSATTGTWNLANGTLSHGVYTATGGASLLIKSGTFDTVTANADVDLTQQANANVTIYNGLVLNANLLIGDAGGSTYGNVYFGDAGHPAGSLTGTGTVLFGGSSSSDLYDYSNQAGAAGALTIGSGITIHGKNGYVITVYANGTIVNQGTINADTAGGTLTVGPITNQGTLEATNGGTLTLTGAWDNSAGTLAVDNGTLNLGGTFAQTHIRSQTRGTVNVTGNGTVELAGSVSDVTRLVNVNDSSTATVGLLVSGTSQVVGAVTGTGKLTVNAGSDLAANRIVQSALVIGGTSTAFAVVTIAPSDASGNPLISTDAASADSTGASAAAPNDSRALFLDASTGRLATDTSFNQGPSVPAAHLPLVDDAILALIASDFGHAQTPPSARPTIPATKEISSSAVASLRANIAVAPCVDFVANHWGGLLQPRAAEKALDDVLAEGIVSSGLDDLLTAVVWN